MLLLLNYHFLHGGYRKFSKRSYLLFIWILKRWRKNRPAGQLFTSITRYKAWQRYDILLYSRNSKLFKKKTGKKSKTDYKLSPKTQKETKKCLQTTTKMHKMTCKQQKAKPLQREWPQTTNATTTPTAWLVVWDLRSLCVSLSLRVYIGQDLLQVCAKGS